VELLCAAMLPPSFVEYALRAGADGVLIAACREGDCEFRIGDDLLAARLAAERRPALRASVPRSRVRVVHAGRTDLEKLREALEAFRIELAGPGPQAARHGLPPKRQETHHG
jgi:coenzyme F420-reducing hydrogenase delta subunit